MGTDCLLSCACKAGRHEVVAQAAQAAFAAPTMEQLLPSGLGWACPVLLVTALVPAEAGYSLCGRLHPHWSAAVAPCCCAHQMPVCMWAHDARVLE